MKAEQEVSTTCALLAGVPAGRALGAAGYPCYPGSRAAGCPCGPRFPCGVCTDVALDSNLQSAVVFTKEGKLCHVCSLAKRESCHLLLIKDSLLQLVAKTEPRRMRLLFKLRSCFRHSCESPGILLLLKAKFSSLLTPTGFELCPKRFLSVKRCPTAAF